MDDEGNPVPPSEDQIEKVNKNTLLTINPFASSITDKDQKLLGAITSNKKVIVAKSATDNTEKTTFKSKNLNELLEFGSLDYSKANYDQATNQYNWDLTYVKSKFDLSEIEKLANSDQDSATSALRQGISSSNQSTKEQALANYVIYLFRHSNLFLTIKDFSPVTI